MLELLSNHEPLWFGAQELSRHKRKGMKEKEKRKKEKNSSTLPILHITHVAKKGLHFRSSELCAQKYPFLYWERRLHVFIQPVYIQCKLAPTECH